ncbi:phage portal protein [Leuconostoc gasicomitatum]|uniref:phage portal protein n=1 Tax=Leuconostoc gasicomitatum TaxID=115778 RepID=UPI0007448ED4|nr:phage portal protein [Leuconostoc gasicomitatum]CUR63896.1 Phage portal protein [Leuconostoc gasicomitatum KG16-1]
MTIRDKLHDFFTKGKISMGFGKTLANITDDPRVNLPVSEIARIREDLDYYSDLFADIKFHNTNNEQRTRKLSTLSITHQAARKLASVIFNEQVTVSVADEEIDGFIDSVLTDNLFNLKYEEYLETGIVTGGFAIRPYVENNTKIKLAWIRADQFVPLQSNTSDIQSAVIVNRTTRSENNKTVWYSLLEFHEFDGVSQETITNELYRSETQSEVGQQTNLSAIDVFNDLPEQAVISDVVRPSFAYFKTPGKNNKSIESPLGIGIVENNKHVIEAINNAQDQFHREVKLGKRRIAIDGTLMKPKKEHAGDELNQGYPIFDPDDDVFMQTGESKDGKPLLQDLTNDIRVDQYSEALQVFIREFENNIGLSQGTLSTDSTKSDKTATEVVSDNSETYRTRSSYITQVEKQIKELIISIVQLATKSELFDGKQSPLSVDLVNNPLEINLHFDDGVFVDKDKQLEEDLKVAVANIMPKKRFLMRNYGLSEDDAQDWIDELQSEAPETDGMSNAQSGMLGGNDGGNDE